MLVLTLLVWQQLNTLEGWEHLFYTTLSWCSFVSVLLVVRGQIRTVVGQAQLLIAQRFLQFSGLVDDCEFKRGEKETTFTDLQGFWDMIYFQVGELLGLKLFLLWCIYFFMDPL